MKRKFFIAALALITTVGLTNAAESTHKVVKEKSNVVWKGEKVTGEHTGNVAIKSGELKMQDGMLVGGSFIIDMTSIICKDLEDAETNAKLVGHLKSDDFFGVKNHPTATLVIKKAVHQGKDDYKVIGDITIKGITKEIKFNAKVNEVDGMISGIAEIVIDRSEFNVRYGSGSFFDSLGDKTIYDEFTMNVNLVAQK